jgi:hypothetical protein
VEHLDLSTFWDDSEHAVRAYVMRPPSDALIASVEAELGYRLSFVRALRPEEDFDIED